MASAFITNALQVNFDSLLGIQNNEGMVQMFRALEATGLRGFLGCPSCCMRNSDVAKVAIVKKKSVSKKKSASISDKYADDVHVEVVAEKAVSKKRPATVSEATVVKKKRTTSGKAVSKEKDRALISVAQDSVPIQFVEPISVVPTERPHAQKQKAPKRKLRMTAGSDDEIVEKEPAVECCDVVEPDVAEGIAMGIDLAEPVVTRSDYITVEIYERSTAVTDEESMSIEDFLQHISGDAMFPYVLAVEPTKIKFGHGIQIPGVHEVEQYKANLPQIAATDKGKEPLVLREQVIEAVDTFFNSFSIRRLPALGSLEAIAAKGEKVMTWGETDSMHIALQRRVYIVVTYRELLLRKFFRGLKAQFCIRFAEASKGAYVGVQ
ncbi:hypothetical protein F511_36556 [Dorcoceras hygrometricum]|uniref:Uncharacterized protein n=1 Tax=Dorcoceras hygrometricum TaxID=472368 RepID=A0A2Z7CTB2_9LAMI|nr:hypothetical protein F511_36556 [Dorcoceras hygrometricum]